MVSFIINWCLNNRFMVMLLTAVLGIAGYYCMINTPVDAIPDIGEKQVVVFVDWPGRSLQDVEDQITYPLTISLQGTPLVKSIRSASRSRKWPASEGLLSNIRSTLIQRSCERIASRCQRSTTRSA